MTFADLVYGILVPAIDQVVIPLLYSLAFIFLLYGLFRYFFNSDSEKRKEGKAFAIWGFIAFFVLFSVWGLVRILLSVLTGE